MFTFDFLCLMLNSVTVFQFPMFCFEIPSLCSGFLLCGFCFQLWCSSTPLVCYSFYLFLFPMFTFGFPRTRPPYRARSRRGHNVHEAAKAPKNRASWAKRSILHSVSLADPETVSKAGSAPRSESSEVLVAATRRIWPNWTRAGERPRTPAAASSCLIESLINLL